MKSIMLVDTTNLYYGVKSRFGGTLHYDSFFKWVHSVHGDMDRVVYVANSPNSKCFIDYLSSLERTKVLVKNPKDRLISGQRVQTTCFDVELAMDAVLMDADKVVICSASIDVLPAVQLLHNEGVHVYIYACGIPKIYEEVAHVKEIGVAYVSKAEPRSGSRSRVARQARP